MTRVNSFLSNYSIYILISWYSFSPCVIKYWDSDFMKNSFVFFLGGLFLFVFWFLFCSIYLVCLKVIQDCYISCPKTYRGYFCFTRVNFGKIKSTCSFAAVQTITSLTCVTNDLTLLLSIWTATYLIQWTWPLLRKNCPKTNLSGHFTSYTCFII